jgi:hypothetical protein
MTKEIVKRTRVNSDKRADWDHNHALIRDAYVKLIRGLGRKPKLTEVQEETGLGLDTICKHLKKIEFKPTKHPLRILTDDVLLGIAKAAMEGNAASQKLWVQLMEGFTEKQITDLQSKGKAISINIIKTYQNDKE